MAMEAEGYFVMTLIHGGPVCGVVIHIADRVLFAIEPTQ